MNTTETHHTLVKFLKAKPKVAFHPAFSLIAGSVTAGLMLSQLWYWSDGRGWNEKGWIWKDSDDWLLETSLTVSEVEGGRKKLLENNLIEYKRMGMPALPHYRIRREEILSSIKALSCSFWSILMDLNKSDSPSSSNIITQNKETGLPENPKQDSQKEEGMSEENAGSGSPNSGNIHTENTSETTSEITKETTTTTTGVENCNDSANDDDFKIIDWPKDFELDDQQEIIIFSKLNSVSVETVQYGLDEFRAVHGNPSRNPITNHILWVESTLMRGVKRTKAGRKYAESRRTLVSVKSDESQLPVKNKPRDENIFKREIEIQKSLCKQGLLLVKG